jgi:spectrin beta
LEEQIAELGKRCSDKRSRLEASKSFHEFMRESEDLELWIGEQMNTASSEEYGQYYEQLLVKRLLTLRRLFIEKY